MTYDNTLKYLVEQYPEDFIHYLLASEATDIQILKTELDQEPIRADSVTFLQTANQILHLINFIVRHSGNRVLDYKLFISTYVSNYFLWLRKKLFIRLVNY